MRVEIKRTAIVADKYGLRLESVGMVDLDDFNLLTAHMRAGGQFQLIPVLKHPKANHAAKTHPQKA